MACAFTDQTVRLPSIEVSERTIAPLFGATVVVPLIVDLREAKDHIGVKKDLFGMGTAKVFPDRNVPIWLRERLTTELRSAGLNIIRKGGKESAVVVQVLLMRLFSEPVFRSGENDYDYETTLAVRLKITSAAGEIADRQYVVTGVARGESPKEKNYTLSVEHATAELMKRLVPEIKTSTLKAAAAGGDLCADCPRRNNTF